MKLVETETVVLYRAIMGQNLYRVEVSSILKEQQRERLANIVAFVPLHFYSVAIGTYPFIAPKCRNDILCPSVNPFV